MNSKPSFPTANQVNGWSRYFSIYGALWRNSLVREMQFKLNFLLWIVVETAWFALQLAFMTVLYSHTESIAGWTKWQVVLLVGCNFLIQQLFIAIFMTNIMEISELIRTGKLDFMLLLPINTRFLVTLRKVDLGGFVNAATALVVIGYSLFRLDHFPSWLDFSLFFIFVIAGVAIHCSLMLLMASVSFWSVKAQGIVWGYYNLFNIARLPDTAFRGVYKVIFTFVLPILLVSNVPARVLTGSLFSWNSARWLLVMAVICYAVSDWVWRFSLRRYTSASS